MPVKRKKHLSKPSDGFFLGETTVEHVRTGQNRQQVKQPGPQILNARKADDQIVICIPMTIGQRSRSPLAGKKMGPGNPRVSHSFTTCPYQKNLNIVKSYVIFRSSWTQLCMPLCVLCSKDLKRCGSTGRRRQAPIANLLGLVQFACLSQHVGKNNHTYNDIQMEPDHNINIYIYTLIITYMVFEGVQRCFTTHFWV